MNMLDAAQRYHSVGFSVSPVGVGPDRKKPFVAWEQYQKKAATEEQILQWWTQWPDANIGIICGQVSGLMVVDCDTAEAVDQVSEMIPDSLPIPTASTPRGGRHFYFRHQSGLISRANVLPKIDIRTDGSYVLAPPSKNSTGFYQWT